MKKGISFVMAIILLLGVVPYVSAKTVALDLAITEQESWLDEDGYFKEEIGVYESENLPPDPRYSDKRRPAWICIYSTGKDAQVEENIKKEFEKTFGFVPTFEVECLFIGEYYVRGCSEPQEIYRYSIRDLTYPLLEDELYVVKHKVCADGSLWVGFPIEGAFDADNAFSKCSKQRRKMIDMFCEGTGFSEEYVRENPDKNILLYGCSLFTARTLDGRVIVSSYIYTRGINVPFDKSYVFSEGHTLIQVEEQPASCDTFGWEAYEYCTECAYTTYSEIPAKEHIYEDYKCTLCGQIDTIRGDTDFDGAITASDIIAIVSAMKSGIKYDKICDIDCDGTITATDITEVIQLIKANTNTLAVRNDF